MGPSESQPARSSKRFGTRKYLICILLAIAVLAVVIPVAVMFGKKKKASTPKSTVIVPLYVYPTPGAWEPLFTA
jgi:hypothetical protein